jgi:hypothetical protein
MTRWPRGDAPAARATARDAWMRLMTISLLRYQDYTRQAKS